MVVVGVDWCDFVVYMPKGLHVERIVSDDEFQSDILMPKLIAFFKEHVLQELFTGALYRNKFSEMAACVADL